MFVLLGESAFVQGDLEHVESIVFFLGDEVFEDDAVGRVLARFLPAQWLESVDSFAVVFDPFEGATLGVLSAQDGRAKQVVVGGVDQVGQELSLFSGLIFSLLGEFPVVQVELGRDDGSVSVLHFTPLKCRGTNVIYILA